MGKNKNQSCIRLEADQKQIDNCKEKILTFSDKFSKTSSLLSIAANETRLKIIYLLNEEKELCPCDLSDILEMSVPAVSQHLRKMKDANVIMNRREGQTIYYSLQQEQTKIIIPLFKNFNKDVSN